MANILQRYEKNFTGARNLLASKNKTSLKLAWETYMRIVDEDNIAIRYFNTDIIVYHSDGSITLDVGQWFTKTTKDRLNQLTPFDVYSIERVWYVCKDNNAVEFFNGIRLTNEGKLLTEPPTTKVDINPIKLYAEKFYDAIVNGEVSIPNEGDCLFCQSLGDATKDADHLISHVEEMYFVPALAANACKDKLRLLNDNGKLRLFGGFHKQRFTRLITDYIYNRLKAWGK